MTTNSFIQQTLLIFSSTSTIFSPYTLNPDGQSFPLTRPHGNKLVLYTHPSDSIIALVFFFFFFADTDVFFFFFQNDYPFFWFILKFFLKLYLRFSPTLHIVSSINSVGLCFLLPKKESNYHDIGIISSFSSFFLIVVCAQLFFFFLTSYYCMIILCCH